MQEEFLSSCLFTNAAAENKLTLNDGTLIRRLTVSLILGSFNHFVFFACDTLIQTSSQTSVCIRSITQSLITGSFQNNKEIPDQIDGTRFTLQHECCRGSCSILQERTGSGSVRR